MDPKTLHKPFEGGTTVSNTNSLLAEINAELAWCDEIGEIDLNDPQHRKAIRTALVHSHGEVIEGSRLHKWLEATKRS